MELSGRNENEAHGNVASGEESNIVSVELNYIPFINLALQQNAVPVVYELLLTNNGGNDLEHLKCTFSSSTGFIQEKSLPIEILKANETIQVPSPGIELDYQLLSSISEMLKGSISLDIGNQEQTLFHKDYEMTAFAADQWLGLKIMPELICSFVTPNLEVINHLMTLVAEELKKVTGSPSINGYAEGRERAYEQCTAIYRAIHTWGINYSMPASSFGVPGQRIRFADTIYKYRLGTCLDTTLLFASAMEACNLHPVIMLQDGHAYIGCHLVERYFADIPQMDLQAIRKLSDLDEFLVIETTMVTGNATFAEAEATARTSHLNIDEDFQCAIDVIRARHSGIQPLPLKRSVEGIVFEAPERKVDKLAAEHKRSLQQEVDLSSLHATELRSGRIARWTQKLLDLSLRNRLLNVRDTQLVIPIACNDISILEDKLAANESISLNPLANLLGEKDLHDLAMLRNSDIKPEIAKLLESELKQKRLWSLLSPNDLGRRLRNMYRQGRTDMEEGGVNTLFLAIGFLEWKVMPRDEKSYLAPILLLPVRLVRKSIAEGIRIERLDEDTIINETLLELLRSQYQLEVPGLSPLPTDKSGVDVGLVMQIFRQTIKEMQGWEVREEARLGLFSFGKFVMWTDMTAREEQLKQNPLVRHLIEGGGIYDDGIEVFPPEEVEKHLKLQELYCPLSADSSQLAAVLYSSIGKSFVLHGPPGTGKSQTITNIIAHNLANGRKVLFVSEKKAALEVVHKRLSAVGLRPFCLELHSNKAGKGEVLAQFAEALDFPEKHESKQWGQLATELVSLRNELNTYVSELHRKYPNGLSAYDCFSRLMSSESLEELPGINCVEQSQEDYDGLLAIVSELSNAFEKLEPGELEMLPWLVHAEWNPQFERNFTKAAQRLADCIEKLRSSHSSLCTMLGLPVSSLVPAIRQFVDIAERLKNTPDVPVCLLAESFADNAQFLLHFCKCAILLKDLRVKLRNYNLDVVKALDTEAIEARIHQNAQSFFLFRFLKNWSLLKELAGLKKLGGTKLSIKELSSVLPDFALWMENSKQYENMLPKAKELLGAFWQEDGTEWEKLQSILETISSINEYIRLLPDKDAGVWSQFIEQLRKVLPEAERRFSGEAAERRQIDEFVQNFGVCQEATTDFENYSPMVGQENDMECLQNKLKRLLEHVSSLRNMFRYLNLKDRACELGIQNFVSAFETGGIPSQEATSMFEKTYAREMLNQILGQSKVLAQFNGLDHEGKIRRFCELDDKYTSLSKNIIQARLAASLPRGRLGQCPEGTELGLLKRECEKKTRQKPVRQLLSEIPTLVRQLKPCFLMSPLSVAQYLPPDSSPFDLIVFDEASQIPVWDAIGVIARGKQLIVVGDPKQMPPTNFFQKGETSEEPDDLEDMESILDECLAAGLESSYLNWHYRSRHEALISFSNHYYYGDRLFTFPSAQQSGRLGVGFRFVPGGIYGKSNTRTNPNEARALVEYIFDKLEKSQDRKRSIGVVTFSEAQKNLIEDMVEDERRKHPGLEAYFSDQNEEPLFVKNLENVQGDERDVILFSICYAPDANGNFSMNFGPLNRQGGERRLNVAITRAKEQVLVFSSIHASDIDLSRTNALGAAHLKYFLDYAEKGFRIQAGNATEMADSSLSRVIEDFLKEKGFSVEHKVGCSGYRIDLAVRNPDNEKEYLLGIECDGPSYASQRTTRDREHLRPSVLRSLGWHIWRAWTVDWVLDRRHAQEELLHQIELARTMPLSAPAEVEEPEMAEEDIPAAAIETRTEKPVVYYQVASIKCGRQPEMFYDISSQAIIKKQIKEVIQQEAPIYEHLLKKRIANAWRVNLIAKTQAVLDACIPDNLLTTQVSGEIVYWSEKQNPAEYRVFRANPQEKCREIDDIPPEELANAMLDILINFGSCEPDALYRETLKVFGLGKVTQKARKYLDFGLQVLKQNNMISQR